MLLKQLVKLSTRLPNNHDSVALATPFLFRGQGASQNVKLNIICCLSLMDTFVKLISLILTHWFKTSGKYYEKVQIKVNDFSLPDYIIQGYILVWL